MDSVDTKETKKWTHRFGFAVMIVLVFCVLIPSQTSPGDETAEETLSRSGRNLHQWGTISSFHGLPSERVRAITQTQDGFIWFGTDSGLAKFDGRRVQTNVFSNLSSVPILALEVGSDGTLWVGSAKGAYYVRDGSFNEIGATRDQSINSIYIEKDAVYLTNETGLVFRCERYRTGFTGKLVLKSDFPIQSIIRDRDDIVLASHRSGLLKMENGKAGGLITRPRPFFVNELKRDKNGKLWLGARSSGDKSGLFATSALPELRIVGENLGTVNSIDFDDSGNTWVGTDERGIFLFNGEEFVKRFTFASTSGSLRSDQILTVFIDREDVAWIGTDEGVNRFDPMSPRNERISDKTQSNFVRVVANSGKDQLLAGTNRGLYKATGEDSGWKSVIEEKSVYAIEKRSGDSWYVGTPNGLFLYDNVREATEEVRSDLDVRDVVIFKGKLYAAAYGRGILEISEETDRRIAGGDVVSLYNEGDERLWIGTTDGKLRTYDGKTVSPELPLTDIENASIWSITGDSKNGIWLSTSKGLILLKDNAVQVLLKEHNIRQTLIIDDKKGDERIWCATEEGLFGLIFDKDFGWISSRSDIEQGFASQNMFSIAITGDNSLVIATNRGIVRKEIRRISPFIIANRILSQRVHQPAELVSGIELEYPQNTLSVEVTALSSRTFPEEFQYAFLLYNSSGEIIKKRFTDKEEFLMDNLSPDTYRVKITAFDRNLTASEPLTFSISVADAPFPWIATILGVLLVIAVTALIWASFSQRKIGRTSRELAFANKELNSARLNLANEAERERHRIAGDLHDQTLADLRHLLLMADDVPTEKAAEFRTEIEGISDEIRRICEDLSPSVLENIGFTAALEWELGNAVEQVSDTHSIETSFVAEENLNDVLNLSRAEQIQIYRITQEVLNNIVRHSKPDKIEMKVGKTKNGVLRMTVRDDGHGFVPGEITNKKGRGLTNINARTQLIKAKVSWKKLPKRGTEFSLTI